MTPFWGQVAVCDQGCWDQVTVFCDQESLTSRRFLRPFSSCRVFRGATRHGRHRRPGHKCRPERALSEEMPGKHILFFAWSWAFKVYFRRGLTAITGSSPPMLRLPPAAAWRTRTAGTAGPTATPTPPWAQSIVMGATTRTADFTWASLRIQ